MKEIKIRILNCETGTFEYASFNDLEILSSTLSEYDRNYIKNNPTYLQFCTEYKDKNGKDIYNGDIVKYDDPSTPYFMRGRLYNKKFFVVGEIDYQSIINEENLEVIGNIHENENLLNAIR